MAVLINGDGNQAIYAQQDADWYAGIVGPITAIMQIGEQFAYEQIESAAVEVKDGVIITQEGRRVQLDKDQVDIFDIPTGDQATTNYYIIGYHLYIDENSEQLCETFVQLMEGASDTIPEGSFRDGDTDVYISLYRITQTGLVISAYEKLLKTIVITLDDISQALDQVEALSEDLGDIDDASAVSGADAFLKIDSLNTKIGQLAASMATKAGLYCVSTESASTSAKTATLEGFTLAEGAQIVVNFAYANTAASPSLSINNGEAKSIKKRTANGTYATFANLPCGPVLLTYDGTQWLVEGTTDITYNGSPVNSIDFALSGDTLTITTT